MIELAKNILTKMKAAEFDQCEVQLSNRAMTEMQIDAGQISLLRTTESDGVGLRGIREKKYATLTLNQIDDKSIENGIEKLTQSCLASPADEARELAPGTQPLSYEFGPLQPKLTQMHERIVEFASNVKNKFKDLKLEQSGLQHNFVRAITLNSKNLCVEEAQGFYSFGAMFSGKRETKTSGFNYSSANRSDLESALLDWGVMEVNMKSTQEEIDHSPFSGKFVGPVVLTPEAFSDFLGAWVSHLGNERLIAGTSCLRDKMNKAVASSLLNLEIAPLDSAFTNHDFVTGDGYLSQPSQVLRDGQLNSFMLSDYGSRKTGLPRAVNSGSHWKIKPGTQSISEMIRPIQQGLWLGRFSGGNPASNGDFSGVAKNSFLIENGVRSRPISEVMISGNLFDLMNGIKALSKETSNDGSKVIPWVLAESVTVSGH